MRRALKLVAQLVLLAVVIALVEVAACFVVIEFFQ